MYGFPSSLDLLAMVGQSATQLHVGQFDLQFNLGPVHFTVESPVTLYRGDTAVARWEAERWPDAGFQEILNVKVAGYEVASNKLLVIAFANGMVMHLADSSDRCESLQITVSTDPPATVIV
jgi:hypothetical protein